MVKVLVVPVDGVVAPSLVVWDADEGAWADLLGDVGVDMVFARDGAAMAVVGGRGKLTGVGVNARGTQLVERLVPGFGKRDFVAGPAVFVGLDEDGVPVDVPVGLVSVARGLFGSVSGS